MGLPLFVWPNIAPPLFHSSSMASQHASYAHVHVRTCPLHPSSRSDLTLLLQSLHASLPPFRPLVPTGVLPVIAWSLLLSAFSLAFYFTTYVRPYLPSLTIHHPPSTSHHPPATSPFPHVSRTAASPRRVSRSRKSRSLS
jgi:hypothetical protein